MIDAFYLAKITGNDNEEYILHNDQHYVTVSFLQSLPLAQRRTLQLVKAVELSVKLVGQRFELSTHRRSLASGSVQSAIAFLL